MCRSWGLEVLYGRDVRFAIRGWNEPDYRGGNLGFRLVLGH